MKNKIKKFGQFVNENRFGSGYGDDTQGIMAAIVINEDQNSMELHFNPAIMHDIHGFEDAVRDEGARVLFVKINPESGSIFYNNELHMQDVDVVQELSPKDFEK